MDRKEKELVEALKKIQDSHEGELDTAFRNIADNIFRHGMSPREAFGVTNERAEHFYAEGFKQYSSGNYQKALPYFQALTMMDGKDPRFCFGLAASLQGLKKYKDALRAYLNVAVLDQQTPHPYFHAADCSLHLGDPISALVFLQSVIDRSGDRVSCSEIKEKAILIKQGLIEKVKASSGGET